jgi:hypothetical protein
MFRAAHRSSSGALSLQPLIYIHMWWSAVAVVKSEWELAPPVPTQTWLQLVTACVCKPFAAKTELLMMSGVPLETCWAVNEWWNNKFRYRVASCWLFILSHITMHGSMNIKNALKLYSLFIWSSTCFGRHTAHHQEPKTALTAFGFSHVEGCWTCGWWTLSGTLCLTTSNFSHVSCPTQLAARDVTSGRMNGLHLLKWFIEIFLGNRRS